MQVFEGEFDVFLKDFFLQECQKHQFSNFRLKREELIPRLLEELRNQGGFWGTDEEAISFIHKHWDGATYLYNIILDDYLKDNYLNVKEDGNYDEEKMVYQYQNPFIHPKDYSYWMIALGLEKLLEEYGFFNSEDEIQLDESFINEWTSRLYKKRLYRRKGGLIK